MGEILDEREELLNYQEFLEETSPEAVTDKQREHFRRQIEYTEGRLKVLGDSESIAVHIYEHPSWDKRLVVEAAGLTQEETRAHAVELLSRDEDETLLTFEEGSYSREELEELGEWDG